MSPRYLLIILVFRQSKSLTDLDNLPEPDQLAEEIIENLGAGLNSFREILGVLENKVAQ